MALRRRSPNRAPRGCRPLSRGAGDGRRQTEGRCGSPKPTRMLRASAPRLPMGRHRTSTKSLTPRGSGHSTTSDDAACEGIDHEGHIDEPGPGRDIADIDRCEVRNHHSSARNIIARSVSKTRFAALGRWSRPSTTCWEPRCTLWWRRRFRRRKGSRDIRSGCYCSTQPLRSRRRQSRLRWNTAAWARAKPAGPEPFSRLLRYRAQSPSFPSRQ